MKTGKFLLIMIAVTVVIVLIGYMAKSQNIPKSNLQVNSSYGEINCIDPEESDLQYAVDKGVTRKQVERIILNDLRIQKIIGTSDCQFMSIGTLYTENGTYQVININLNNTKVLAASISLRNDSVVSYDIGHLVRANTAK